VDLIPADLLQADDLFPLVCGTQAIFHTAGSDNCYAPWESLYRAHALGTNNLLEAALKAGVERVVSWSSCRVYGKAGRNREPLDETSPVCPRDPLGRSRAIQDAAVWRYHDMGLPATILRPGTTYGPRSHGLAALCRRLKRLPAVPVPYNLTSHVMSVHVRDLVRAAAHLALKADAAGQEYHIVDNIRYPAHNVLSMMAAALGKRKIPVYIPGPLLKAGSRLAAYMASRGEQFLQAPSRSEAGELYSLTSPVVLSNRKIKESGFLFHYPDLKDGLSETMEALSEEGFL